LRTELSRRTLCINEDCVTVFPLFGTIVHVVYRQEVCVVSVISDESPSRSLCSVKVCEGSGKGDVNGRFGWEFWIEDGLFDDVEVLDGQCEMSKRLSILKLVVVRVLTVNIFSMKVAKRNDFT
jgi:hypothetical protein